MRLPRHHQKSKPSLSLVLLSLLLATLWLVGGASRADALGQTVTRGAAWALLAVGIVWGDWRGFRTIRPVALLLAAMVALPLLQLIPLPPAIWTALPGRDLLLQAAAISGEPQPWRPWSIVPSATVNAASSLVVPVAVLCLGSGLKDDEHFRILALLLVIVAASMFIGLLQLSGISFSNPFINETLGEMSGSFANRNHFALFLAVGCLLAPAWLFVGNGKAGWRWPMAVGLILLFVLAILASGSRAGLLLGLVALGTGTALAWGNIRQELRRAPRWAFPALIAGTVALVAFFVLLSVVFGRAESINRALAGDPLQDMRHRALPTVLAMIGTYFPAGTGFGTFDPVFRIHEPFGLLKATYFNHAHDDFLEILLDGGAPALVLLVVSLGWGLYASVRAWSSGPGAWPILAKLGSAMLLLVLIASLFDYPTRTPMIMALVTQAAAWMCRRECGPALPKSGQHL